VPGRILVVEDDPTVREQTRRASARRWRAATAGLRPPDVMLPDLDGFEVPPDPGPERRAIIMLPARSDSRRLRHQALRTKELAPGSHDFYVAKTFPRKRPTCGFMIDGLTAAEPEAFVAAIADA
jgi:hypothetical protein